MGKISISVLVIWAVIGFSLVTLYPIAENIQDRKTVTDSGNSQSGIGSGNSQTNIDSGNSLSGTGSDNLLTGTGSGNLLTGVGSGNLITGIGSGNSQSGTDSNSQSGVDSGNSQTGTASGNKYLVNNFFLNITNFTAEITNLQDAITGDGVYEIKTNPSANHKDVLQSGTFSHSLGTFTISHSLNFTPVNNENYHILVYTNYPEHDNRVSEDGYQYKP